MAPSVATNLVRWVIRMRSTVRSADSGVDTITASSSRPSDSPEAGPRTSTAKLLVSSPGTYSVSGAPTAWTKTISLSVLIRLPSAYSAHHDPPRMAG